MKPNVSVVRNSSVRKSKQEKINQLLLKIKNSTIFQMISLK